MKPCSWKLTDWKFPLSVQNQNDSADHEAQLRADVRKKKQMRNRRVATTRGRERGREVTRGRATGYQTEKTQPGPVLSAIIIDPTVSGHIHFKRGVLSSNAVCV